MEACVAMWDSIWPQDDWETQLAEPWQVTVGIVQDSTMSGIVGSLGVENTKELFSKAEKLLENCWDYVQNPCSEVFVSVSPAMEDVCSVVRVVFFPHLNF